MVRSKQSSAYVLTLGSGDATYGVFQVCVENVNIRKCADSTCNFSLWSNCVAHASITGGSGSQSFCDMTNKYAYCDKSSAVIALVIAAIFACALCSLLIGYHVAQVILHVAASLFGLVAMALWLSIQTSINDDNSANGRLNLDYCGGIVIFCWLVNAAGAMLTAWGGRGSPVLPSNMVVSSSRV